MRWRGGESYGLMGEAADVQAAGVKGSVSGLKFGSGWVSLKLGHLDGRGNGSAVVAYCGHEEEGRLRSQ